MNDQRHARAARARRNKRPPLPRPTDESTPMAPPDHDNDHGERLAVLETTQAGHTERLRAIEDKIWWAMVAVVGTAGSVLWQLVPSFIKGLGGK